MIKQILHFIRFLLFLYKILTSLKKKRYSKLNKSKKKKGGKKNYAVGQHRNIEFPIRVIVTQAQGNINTATCHIS